MVPPAGTTCYLARRDHPVGVGVGGGAVLCILPVSDLSVRALLRKPIVVLYFLATDLRESCSSYVRKTLGSVLR